MVPALIEAHTVDWGLVVTLVTQVVSCAFIAGIGWTRLNTLEKDISRLETEFIDYRLMRQDLAVVKTQLQSIQACLNHMADRMDKEEEHNRHHA